MPKLATLEDILVEFSYENSDEIKRLTSGYLELVTEELGTFLGTPFDRGTHTDVFWYDDRARASALPYTQFNLKAGFVQGAVSVEYAPTLNDLMSGSPLVIPAGDITLRWEQGVVHVHDPSRYSLHYYKMQYTAGFTTEPYEEDVLPDTVLYQGVPEWLRRVAIVRTSQMVREHYAPKARSTLVDRRLADLVDLRARRFGPSVRPIA